jgi:large subunit ribosomal protein L32
MGLPKRRHSQTRGRKRRTHYKAVTPPTAVCPNCGLAILPHRVCTNCGHYKGRKVLEVTEP